MFHHLRLRLTLLYLLGGLLLVAAVCSAAYLLLQDQYRRSIDLALEHRAALALHEVGEPLPAALAQGEKEWYAERGGNPPPVSLEEGGEEPDSEDGETSSALAAWQAGEPEFDAELSPIAMTAVRSDGTTENITGGKNPFFNAASVEAALQNETDFRTVSGSSENRIRVFSLRLSGVPGYLALQVSRSLEDQDRILGDLVKSFLQWGIVFAFILTAVSWWLSGRALQSAQESWDKQQAFVAHAGHELRTPLTMIRAAAEITRRKLPAGDDRRGPVEAIIAEADRMGRIVGDLLLLSRLDAGALHLELKTVDLVPLVEEVAVSFGRVAQEQGVRLSANCVPGKVKADELRLRQVVLILLDNALRHSPEESRIELELARVGSKIQLTVRDHGVGISPEDLPHIFDRFYRGRGERSESGSGLGLAIAKELTEAMHGKLRISSQSGLGTAAMMEMDLTD